MDAIAATIAFLLYLTLSSSGTRAETQHPKQILPGSFLYPNASWHSPSGLFAFGFYQQGSGFAVGIWLVGVKNRTVVWTANRDDPPVTSNAKLQLTGGGKLLLLTEQGQDTLIDANATASYASMLDSGNFVLYNKNSSIVWQSFDYPTDTMLGHQALPTGGQLVCSSSETNSSTGRFRLKMQVDGNLVLYPLNTADVGADAYWASNTFDNNVFKFHLYLNKSGPLQIMNGTNLNVITYLYGISYSASNGNRTIYRATLDFDGIFRMYVHHNNDSGIVKVKNWPDEDNACSVKGFCGFNSYCTFDDQKPYCNCLPGFDFIDPNQKTLGCKRNFSEGECRGEKDNVPSFTMVQEMNMEWGGRPYFEANISQKNAPLLV